MKQLYVKTGAEWRRWLSNNHDREKEVWLMCFKKKTGKLTISYDDSVEEALCFGWIDSLVKTIDESRYLRKFTPRKSTSRWSASNIVRIAKLVEAGRMTRFGLEKVEAARSAGKWQADEAPALSFEMPAEFEKALRCKPKARGFFEALAPTYKKQYIGWIETAKRAETRAKRIEESVLLLEKGKRLGLK